MPLSSAHAHCTNAGDDTVKIFSEHDCELTVNSSCVLATLSHDCDIKHTCIFFRQSFF